MDCGVAVNTEHCWEIAASKWHVDCCVPKIWLEEVGRYGITVPILKLHTHNRVHTFNCKTQTLVIVLMLLVLWNKTKIVSNVAQSHILVLFPPIGLMFKSCGWPPMCNVQTVCGLKKYLARVFEWLYLLYRSFIGSLSCYLFIIPQVGLSIWAAVVSSSHVARKWVNVKVTQFD